jgi:predicted ATPase
MSAASPPLLERDNYLQSLTADLDQAAAGHGRAVFLGGEAGVGKTALVDRFTRSLPVPARVLWGACDPLFTPRALGPLRDMAAQRPASPFASLNFEQDRAALFAAVLAELSRAAALVVVEDLHWADEATLDLIKYLARRIARTRALLIATYRDDELASPHPLRTVLGDLATVPALRRVSLAPLSAAAVRAWVADRRLDAAAIHQ